MITRRGFVQLGAGVAAAVALAPRTAVGKRAPETMNRRTIPSSGKTLAAIGLGTWQTFDVGAGAAARTPLVEVLRRFLAAGGELIDSSPMYGRSEEVTGDLLAELKATAFLATKVWTSGKRAGVEQMQRSMRRMRTQRMDLMQVHNLLDVKTHLPVLREWKQAGTITYLGITHYAHSAFAEMERLLRTEKLDFVQLPYNIADRTAEKRLLPAAADTGTAVLVMRPFEEGALFRKVKGVPLPAWAADFDCTSWAQFFLKFIASHPAVTAPIPATSNPDHVDDNVRAGFGRLPDAAMRKRMIAQLGLWYDAGMAIRLYSWPRSSGSRVNWALEELGLPYEYIALDRAKNEHQAADYLAVNPSGKVPALVDGDHTMFESAAILIYLGERYGADKGLWPAPGPARAEALSWTVWSTTELLPYLLQYAYHGLDTPVSYKPADRSAAAAEFCRGHFERHLAMLEQRVQGRDYIMGDFSLVDIPIAATLHFAGMLGVPVAGPAVKAWLDRCMQRPAVRRIR